MNPVIKSVTLNSRTPSRVRRVIPHFELPPLSPPIELAHLTTLVLCSDTLKTSYIVSSLSTPNLRHLKLAGLCEEWDATIQNLIATNAIGRLETLSIIYRYVNVPAEKLSRSDAFIELLRHASRLKSLELFHVSHIGPVLRALAQAASDVPSTAPVVALCPQLSTLDVSQCPDVNDELLMDIVKARNDNLHTSQAGRLSVSLHKLVINSCEQVSRATLSELKERVSQVICHYDWKQREKHVGQPTQSTVILSDSLYNKRAEHYSFLDHDASHW
ncbi:hypothetical protein BC629DRAFT_381375 [Irpex lacteus]|nr:hypothetical protein BC629DRAFT_381375 [Irpex lacteus]